MSEPVTPLAFASPIVRESVAEMVVRQPESCRPRKSR